MALSCARALALATARLWLAVAAARWAARLCALTWLVTSRVTPALRASSTTTPTITAATLLILIFIVDLLITAPSCVRARTSASSALSHRYPDGFR